MATSSLMAQALRDRASKFLDAVGVVRSSLLAVAEFFIWLSQLFAYVVSLHMAATLHVTRVSHGDV